MKLPQLSELCKYHWCYVNLPNWFSKSNSQLHKILLCQNSLSHLGLLLWEKSLRIVKKTNGNTFIL